MRRAPPRGRTFETEVGLECLRVSLAQAGRAWPATKWQRDPVGFAYTVLGVEKLWSFQVEFLEAIRDNDRVAVCGGRKIGKDFAIAIAALWFYASFADARVFMTAVTSRQVDGILYRDVRRLFHRSGRCQACRASDPAGPPPCPHSGMLTGRVSEVARSGIKADDFRELTGFTTREAEGAAGYSGPCMMTIFDESSRVKDSVHAAYRGNMGGCAPGFGKEVCISNGTRRSGFFFDAFHSKSRLYKTLQVSSRTTPNFVAGHVVIPGLATREWVEEQLDDWGDGSELADVHIDGKFPKHEKGAIFSVDAIDEAESRWEETQPTGRINIGVDPAGAAETGDESAFAARRGKKVLELYARRALTADGHLVEVLGLLAKHPAPSGEDMLPRVVIDREGEVGAKVWGVFVAYLQTHDGAFDLVGVRASERAQRQPDTYDRTRDELVASLADWLRDGGAIPEDIKLKKELNAFRWIDHISGRSKLVSKDDLRKEIGRSPDRADALALSAWGAKQQAATAEEPAHEAPAQQDVYDAREAIPDPYAGVDVWR